MIMSMVAYYIYIIFICLTLTMYVVASLVHNTCLAVLHSSDLHQDLEECAERIFLGSHTDHQLSREENRIIITLMLGN